MDVSRKKEVKAKEILLKNSSLIFLIALIIISSILSPQFLDVTNFMNILRQNAVVFMLAIGLLMVIQTGGIDLSVAGNAAVCGMLFAIAISWWAWNTIVGLILAIIVSIAVGIGIGALNGVLISYVRMPAFIVTLATAHVLKGVVYQMVNGESVRLIEGTPASNIIIAFPNTGIGLITWPIICVIIVFFTFLFITKKTVFGRITLAVGSNQEAVTLAGINAKRYKFQNYLLAGAMCGIGGILMTARVATATPMSGSGSGYELDAIAACVIGGASLAGGRGTAVGTLIGVIIMALIVNIMNLLSVPAYPMEIIKGAIIVGSVFMQGLSLSPSEKGH
jgi:ribose transport system permease protein